ncbi:hypothetical protein D3C85_744410 [compost metagenome]
MKIPVFNTERDFTQEQVDILQAYGLETIEEEFKTSNGHIRSTNRDYITIDNFLDLFSLHDRLKAIRPGLHGILIREYDGRLVIEIYDTYRE